MTGSQEGARKLLEELEIDKRYYGQLSPEEQDLLNETLIRRSKNPDARVTFYTFEGMPRGPLRDTREAASLINACGRMGQPDTAVQALLTRDARRAIEVQRTYRTRVKKAHEWYEQLKPGVEDGLLLLNGKESILPSVAGVLCSSLVRGGSVPEGTVVVCLARYGNGTTKVSARTDNPERNLARLLVETAAAVGGEGGGHDCAAGAIIPTEAERSFLERVRAAF